MAGTPEDGAFDLASGVAGGISSAGFTRLSAASLLTPNLFGGETILGTGNAGSNAGTVAVFAATPEPGSAALLALGAAFLATRRRRR